MKKNYFMVLIALLVFALNANAQDATGQDETNNRMTVKMNDGTSFILNTDNVAEITFGDGQPAFSAQNIAKALEALDELGQYVNRFEALENNDAMLMDYVTQLAAVENDTRCRVDENQCEIDVLKRDTENLKMVSSVLDDRLAIIEARTTEVEAAIAALVTRSDNQDKNFDQLLNSLAEENNKNNYQEANIAELHAYMNNLAAEVEALKVKVASMQQ